MELSRAEQMKLFEEMLPMVDKIVERIHCRTGRYAPKEDLLSAGRFGAWQAVIRQPEHEFFRNYCATRVAGAVLDELRAQDWAPRRARRIGYMPQRSVFDPDEVFEGMAAPEYDVLEGLLQEDLVRAAARLPDRLREVVVGRLNGRTNRDLARVFGVTDTRVSQLYSLAVHSLRDLLCEEP